MTQLPPPPPVYAPPAELSPADQRMWATLIHVGGILFYWLAPLIGYLVLKERGPFIREHTAAALNFHITMAIAYAAGIVLLFAFGIGLIVLLAVAVVVVVFAILAALAANRGELYRYPISFTFIR